MMPKLLEYEAKAILRASGLPVPESTIVTRSNLPSLQYPTVLKSQVPTGGRGKLGGVIVVDDSTELTQVVDGLFNLAIRGLKPQTLLAEEKLAITHEYYISLIINRTRACIELVAHKNGGVDVEENNPEEFLRLELTGKNHEIAGESLAEHLGREDQSFVLQDMVERLYDCFVKNDATLIEINPLVYIAAGKLVCGDAKIELDDAAAFRHSDWQFETVPEEVNFVTLNMAGNVATIANGAGLAMATVDAVSDHGLLPANFLDIGGGANTASVLRAFERIMEFSSVRAIVINIFAGITRCDEVAKAIIAAKQQINQLPPLYIRLAGTNHEAAAELLKQGGIPLFQSLDESLVATTKELQS